jgi:hypothetical protein
MHGFQGSTCVVGFLLSRSHLRYLETDQEWSRLFDGRWALRWALNCPHTGQIPVADAWVAVVGGDGGSAAGGTAAASLRTPFLRNHFALDVPVKRKDVIYMSMFRPQM